MAVAVAPPASVPYDPGFPEVITAPTALDPFTASVACTFVATPLPVFFNRTVTCHSSPGSTVESPSPHTCTRLPFGLYDVSYVTAGPHMFTVHDASEGYVTWTVSMWQSFP